MTFIWAQSSYPTPDPSAYDFNANSLSLPVENADSFESEGVDCSQENSFVLQVLFLLKKMHH